MPHRYITWALVWGLGFLGGCSPTLTRYEYAQPHMGTVIQIKLYAIDESTASGAAAAAFARIAKLSQRLSDYLADSEFNRLGRSAGSGQAVPISDDLFAMLAAAQHWARRTGGAFDITLGPAVRLWRRAQRQRELPRPDRLAEAMRAVGHTHLILDAERRTATLRRPNMRLDPGGIGKGYIAQQALAVLRRRGTGRAMINAGGDVVLGAPPPGQTGWTVQLLPMVHGDETNVTNTPADGLPPRLVLANCAVMTSGDAFQHVVIDGVRYSHIIDPRTGLGLTTSRGASVIAPDGADADALATALCVMGPRPGLALIEQRDATHALIVERDEQGAFRYFRSADLSTLPTAK